ncbi:MAG: sugar transferase [Planctomycetes bacterium]|nr:sugar transferase [Planctomycetota bacterium]
MAVRNEATCLEASLGAVLAQDWPPDRLEVFVVDGGSSDGTAELATRIAAAAPVTETVADTGVAAGTPYVRVLRNSAGHAAAGLNIGLAAALRRGSHREPENSSDSGATTSGVASPDAEQGTTHSTAAAAQHGSTPRSCVRRELWDVDTRAAELPDFIVRVDGHAEIAPDFVRRAVDVLLATGADAAGGPMVTAAPTGSGAVGRAVALAMSTPFGAGNASFRTGASTAGDVDTVAFAAYQRGVFDRLGGFDETFPRNQDDEFHLRLTRSGGRIRLDPAIRSTYRSRRSPAAAARQYFGYGFHKARVLRLHGRLPTLRGLAPPALVSALLATVVAAIVSGDAHWLLAVSVPYAVASMIASLAAVSSPQSTSSHRASTHDASSRNASSPIVPPRAIAQSPPESPTRSPSLRAAALVWLPIAYAALHVGYGLGFLVGVPVACLRPPVPRVPGPRDREFAERNRLERVYARRDADPATAPRDDAADPGHAWLVANRERRLRRLLGAEEVHTLGEGPHLDVGCGRGSSAPLLRALGARGRIVGIDSLAARLAAAVPDGESYAATTASSDHISSTATLARLCGDASRLPFRSRASGSALLATIASSIADPELRRRAAREAVRVLRPGGVALWYDLRMRGRTTTAISAPAVRCLFPGCRVTTARAGLIPPLARAAARISPRLCDLLAALPPLRSHLVAVIRRADDVPPSILARGETRRRVIDVALAVPAIVVVAPVIGVLAVLVRLDSPGPAFHRSPRVGRGAHAFEMLKLRTMAVAASPTAAANARPLTAEDDPRVTKIGAFLRRTHLDELPQLWNVFRGDMAIVGPRPETPVFVDRSDARWQSVLAVRPGITGPTQLAFSPREGRRLTGPDPESVYRTTILPRKLRTDATYLARRTTLTDLGWIARTACAALRSAFRSGSRR